ncbi:hypothetical protein niasHS_010697 [Heterodera schachtii]|uniref:Uncharacterized protein n=1 Tax=Heterodera schachtii TaxID=97005 RepID=A0ABD2IYG9_HETSC
MPNQFGFAYQRWDAPRNLHPPPFGFNRPIAPFLYDIPQPFFGAPNFPQTFQGHIANPQSDMDLRPNSQAPEQQHLMHSHSMHNPSSISAEVNEWKNKYQGKMTENNSMKKQLEGKTKECDSLKGSVNELQKQLMAMGTTTMPRELNELKNERKDLIKKNKEKDETIAKLKKKMDEDSRKMANMLVQEKKKEEEHRKTVDALKDEYQRKIEEVTKKKDQSIEKQRTENDRLKAELSKNEKTIQEQKQQLAKDQQHKTDRVGREEALREQKRQLTEQHRTETEKLKTEMRKTEEEAITQQRNQMMEEQREKNDKLRTELFRKKEEALLRQKEQFEEESQKKMDELEAKLRNEYELKLEQSEKQLRSEFEAEIGQLKGQLQTKAAETDNEQMNNSFDGHQECEAKHCGDSCETYKKMVSIYNNVISKHAKEATCDFFEPILFGPNIIQRAQHSHIELRLSAILSPTNDPSPIPTQSVSSNIENTSEAFVAGLRMAAIDSLNDAQGTVDEISRRDGENQSTGQMPCASEAQAGEERPPSLERSESVANSLPSVNFNQSPQDHFEETKQQTREKIAQEMGLSPDDPVVEIRVQREMAIYNKRAVQQQNVSATPPPLTADISPATDQNRQNIPMDTVSREMDELRQLCAVTQTRRQIPTNVASKEMEELRQRLESAGNAQQQQQQLHSANIRQNALSANSQSSNPDMPSKLKRKLGRSSSGDQLSVGVEQKQPRMNVQQQQNQPMLTVHNPNIQMQPNIQPTFVGYPLPGNSQLHQAVQQQQCVALAFGSGGHQQMQQQNCYSSTTNADCWGQMPLYNQQQQVPTYVPQFQQFAYPSPSLPSHNQPAFQHQQQQQMVQPQQFHQSPQPIIRSVVIEPSHNPQMPNVFHQQSNAQHGSGSAQFSPSDVPPHAPPSPSTTTIPIAKKIVADFFRFFDNSSSPRNCAAIVQAFLTSRRDTMTTDQIREVFPQLTKLAEEMIRGIKQNFCE